MKKLMVFGVIAFFAFSYSSFAQDEENDDALQTNEVNVLDHKVSMGETVMMISKKYMVKPQDIYEINPEAVNGLQSNMTVKIPADKIKAKLKPEQQNNIHKEYVKSKSFKG